MKRCACIDTLYTELPFYDRFQAAKQDGFESVEFWDWRVYDLDKVKAAAGTAGIAISGFNGDADYSLVDPSHKERYLAALKDSLEAAVKTGASSVTIHSNALGEGGIVVDHYDELSPTVKLCSMYDTLLAAVPLAAQYNIRMNLEGLNSKVDHVGNFLQTTQMAAEVTGLIHSPYLKILYDAYHMQYNEGAICYHIEKYIDQIGHIHIADAPGRHEPGTGEINYSNVYQTLERLGYAGRVGYELFPETDTKTAVKAIMKD
jgi:hydroxypyruvate isomerase